MSIYDPVDIGPVRFEPDFVGGGEAVTVSVKYAVDGNPNGEQEESWHPDAGRGLFCISLRAWEAFQHYGRSAHG